MKAIHPKFLKRRVELFGLEARDAYICIVIVTILKIINMSEIISMGIPLSYLILKFVVSKFFPRSHFYFWLQRKKYFEWNRVDLKKKED
jgi:hypothetical protein